MDDLPKSNATLFTSISMVSVVFPVLIGASVDSFGYRMTLLFIFAVVVILGVILALTIRTASRIGFRA